jgi:hypothetical protein
MIEIGKEDDGASDDCAIRLWTWVLGATGDRYIYINMYIMRYISSKRYICK